MKYILLTIFVALAITAKSQPILFRSKSYMGEACEYVNNERKCTTLGMLKDKKNVFLIFQDYIEWSTNSLTSTYTIDKIDKSNPELCSYMAKDKKGDKYIFNLKSNGKLLAVLNRKATLTFFKEQ